MKYLYGPVDSRRLGLSLGVSLTPYKTCDFDCLYCQLGRTARKITLRKEYIKINLVIREIRLWLKQNYALAKRLDYITLSGFGEPALNLKIGRIILAIKKITATPVAVITNSSWLVSPTVRKAVALADLVLPSLDAATQGIFERIDRPAKNIKISRIIKGLVKFRRQYQGKLWLEIMLVKGVNDSLAHIRQLKMAAEEIQPDKIQLNLPVRRTAEADIFGPDKARLRKIKAVFGSNCEIA